MIETTHARPAAGSGLMPCCGRTPFEVPRTDRMAEDAAAVTCTAQTTLDSERRSRIVDLPDGTGRGLLLDGDDARLLILTFADCAERYHEQATTAEAAIARVRAVQPYTARTHGDRSQGYRLGWNAARDAMLTALDDDAPADATPPDPLAALHTWLTAEAAHHHAAVPLCRIPEAAQAHDGMGAGLDIAARVVAGLIAGRGLPVSGGVKPAGEAPASGHGETPGDGGDGR